MPGRVESRPRWQSFGARESNRVAMPQDPPATSDDSAPNAQPYPVIHILECKACGRCIAACPRDVLVMSDEFNDRGYHYVRYVGEGCVGCADCYYTCPEPGAIELHIPEKPKHRKDED